MSSKRRLRRKACEGKQRHADRGAAVRHRDSLRHAKGESGLGVYHCKTCKHWHVGHSPGSGFLFTKFAARAVANAA